MTQRWQRLQRRWARWSDDARYRRLFRQQLWQQRRTGLRRAVRRAWIAERSKWRRRSALLSRHSSRLWSTLSGRLRLAGAGLWRRLSGLSSQVRGWHPSRRVTVTTAALLLGGVAGCTAILAVGDRGDPRPSGEETARSAANNPTAGARVPGLTQPGIFVSVGVDEVGELEVAEQARTDQPVTELSIAPPPALDGASPLPRLEDVRVSADGVPVEVLTTVQMPTVVVLDRPAKVIELHYRLVGATARSASATPGRATLSLRPALASSFGESRTMIEVHGIRVHAMVCVDLPPNRQLCGVARDGAWRTQRLDTTSSTVVALVDLPDPGV